MAYTTTLTDAGKELLRTALLNEGSIIFTNLMIGSGTPPQDASGQTSLVNPVVSAPITSMSRGSGYFCRIVATLYNTEVLVRFNVTELGLYAKPEETGTPILYAYVGITEGDGGTVPPGANILIEREYTINVFVGDAQDVSADVDSSEAATKAELNAHNNSTTAHENRFVLKQDRTDLLTATASLNDNDVAPIYTSGKLHRKVTLGNLFTYIKNKITLTAADMPLIPVNKGGTGRTALTQYATLLGNGTNSVGMVSAVKGAFHVTQNNTAPKFGTLPVDVGGTGHVSFTANAVLAGNGANAVKEVASNTGAFYSTGAGAQPQFGTLPVNVGGSGRTTLTAHSVLLGNGTGAVTMRAASAGAFYGTGNTADPVFGTLPVAYGGTGKASHTANATLVGNGNSIGEVPSATGAYYSTANGSKPRFGTLPVNVGGTGATNLTAHAVLLGNGAAAITAKAAAAGAFYGTGNTADPTFGILPTGYGGTGNNSGYIRAGLASGVTAGSRATAEGYNATTTGDNSHGEGHTVTAFGNQSHAEGTATYANSRSQHVFGEYNVKDTENKTGRGTFVEIVGNGASTARSNARTLTWSGDEAIAGSFTPMVDANKDIGTSTKRWKNLFAVTLNGALAKTVTFNNGGNGAASGGAFNGGSDVVVSYNTVGAAPTTHYHTPAQINTDGRLGATVYAKLNAALGTPQIRNIYAGTTDRVPGESDLNYGYIYLVYE